MKYPLIVYWYKLLIRNNRSNINNLTNELNREMKSLDRNSERLKNILKSPIKGDVNTDQTNA